MLQVFTPFCQYWHCPTLPEEEDEEDEEDDEDGDDEDEGTVIEAQLRHIWHLVSDGAVESIEKNLPLHLQT